jgi:predicted dehydrogenase
MTDRLRMVLLGAGGVRNQHLPGLARIGRTELVGVLCRTVESAAVTAAEWGGTPYDSLGRMLDEQRPEVAWVCLPPYSTGWACEQLAERGIPFLVEKPLDVGSDRPARIAATVRGKGIVAAVGYNWRALDFLPEVRHRLSERPAHLVVARWIGDTPGGWWWRQREKSGGQMVEQVTHQFDLARALLGEGAVVEARAARHERPAYPGADIDDVTTALVRFESGALGAFSATCLAGAPRVEMEFVSDGLVATIAQLGTWPAIRWSVTFEDAAGRRTRANRRDPFEVEDRAFLDAVDAGDPARVMCTYQDALGTDRLVRAVVAAAEAAPPG